MKLRNKLTLLTGLSVITLGAIPVASCSNTPTNTTYKLKFVASEEIKLSFNEIDLPKGRSIRWSQIQKPVVTLPKDYTDIGWFDGDTMTFPDVEENDILITEKTSLRYVAFSQDAVLKRAKVKVLEDTIYLPVLLNSTWGEFIDFYGIRSPEIEHYKFDGWFNKATQKIMADSDVIIDNISVEAKFTQIENDFSTDTWQVVCEQAEKGLDSLKKFYKVESFIGMKRTIYLNGLAHKVRVIGENHDTYTDGGVEKKTTLTFELRNLVSDEYGYPLKTYWQDGSSASSYEYLKSGIYRNLNSTQPVKWVVDKDEEVITSNITRSCATMMVYEDKALWDHIKEVNKQVPNKESELINYKCRLFPLSLTEFGLKDDKKPIGTPYEYYTIHKEGEYREKAPVKDISDIRTIYATTSPRTIDTPSDEIYCVYCKNGDIISCLVNYSLEVCFAFCI